MYVCVFIYLFIYIYIYLFISYTCKRKTYSLIDTGRLQFVYSKTGRASSMKRI